MSIEVKITAERLAALEKSERWLNALRNSGVDNWDGYEFAVEDIRAEEEVEDFIEELTDELIAAVGENVDEPAGTGCGYGVTERGSYEAEKVVREYLDKWDARKAKGVE